MLHRQQPLNHFIRTPSVNDIDLLQVYIFGIQRIVTFVQSSVVRVQCIHLRLQILVLFPDLFNVQFLSLDFCTQRLDILRIHRHRIGNGNGNRNSKLLLLHGHSHNIMKIKVLDQRAEIVTTLRRLSERRIRRRTRFLLYRVMLSQMTTMRAIRQRRRIHSAHCSVATTTTVRWNGEMQSFRSGGSTHSLRMFGSASYLHWRRRRRSNRGWRHRGIAEIQRTIGRRRGMRGRARITAVWID
mmetsp:Transcript_2845/g.4683  ORF Transcript_2845/g.4683 Transcript_2845/m.4683 type:complete len:241 (+) Transcript_2845:96-818(+)